MDVRSLRRRRPRYCYVYAYSEEAIFKTPGYGGEVIFFDNKDKCDVKTAVPGAICPPLKWSLRR